LKLKHYVVLFVVAVILLIVLAWYEAVFNARQQATTITVTKTLSETIERTVTFATMLTRFEVYTYTTVVTSYIRLVHAHIINRSSEILLYVFEGEQIYSGYKGKDSYDFANVGALGAVFVAPSRSRTCGYVTMEGVSIPLKVVALEKISHGVYRVSEVFVLEPGAPLTRICTDDYFLELDPAVEVEQGDLIVFAP